MTTYWTSSDKVSITKGHTETMTKASLGFNCRLTTKKHKHKFLCNDKNSTMKNNTRQQEALL